MQEQLTVKQALEQGYEYFGKPNETYQIVCGIDEFDDYFDPEDEFQTFLLFEKGGHTMGTCDEELREIIADVLSEKFDSETHDDTSEMRDLLMGIDLTETAIKINEALKERTYHTLTDIELIP